MCLNALKEKPKKCDQTCLVKTRGKFDKDFTCCFNCDKINTCDLRCYHVRCKSNDVIQTVELILGANCNIEFAVRKQFSMLETYHPNNRKHIDTQIIQSVLNSIISKKAWKVLNEDMLLEISRDLNRAVLALIQSNTIKITPKRHF